MSSIKVQGQEKPSQDQWKLVHSENRKFKLVLWYFQGHSAYSVSSVQLLSHVRLFVTPWTTTRQASLSITNSQSFFKLMSIESVIPSNHLILCHPFVCLHSIFPIIRVFPKSQFFASGGQSTGASASTSVLPVNIQDWFPLGLTGLISLQSKGLSRVFCILQDRSHPGP